MDLQSASRPPPTPHPPSARSADPAPLDTIRLNETPEGVDLGLRVAGPAPRALALVVDGAIRLGIYLALTPLLALAGLGVGVNLIAVFLLEWLYPVSFEVITGATPGKRALGLKVVHDDGTPVGLPASLIRNVLRVVDFLPIFYGLGLVCTLVDRDFRRLGDLAAGTLVVHLRRHPVGDGADAGPRDAGRRRNHDDAATGGRTDADAVPDAPPCQPPLGLPLVTQQSLLAYRERAPRLSAPRRIELAETLLDCLPATGAAPPSAGPRGWAAVERVRGYGTWLARGRAGD